LQSHSPPSSWVCGRSPVAILSTDGPVWPGPNTREQTWKACCRSGLNDEDELQISQTLLSLGWIILSELDPK